MSGIHLPASEESGKVRCNAFELGSELLLKTARSLMGIIQIISNVCFSCARQCNSHLRANLHKTSVSLTRWVQIGKDVNVASFAFAETRLRAALRRFAWRWCISSSTCYFDDPIIPPMLIYWIGHIHISSVPGVTHAHTHTYTFSRVHFPRVFSAFDVKYVVPLLLFSLSRPQRSHLIRRSCNLSLHCSFHSLLASRQLLAELLPSRWYF